MDPVAEDVGQGAANLGSGGPKDDHLPRVLFDQGLGRYLAASDDDEVGVPCVRDPQGGVSGGHGS